MAQGKLSQQVTTTQSNQQRPSRTRKKLAAFQQKKQRQRFESLQRQAQEVQETQFKDKTVQEKYTELIPTKFNKNDRTRSQWYEKPQSVRDRFLENAKRNKYRGEWSVDSVERTRNKVIPFTIEDGENSYENVYNTLSGDLKQFFQTPEEVKEARVQRIATTKQQIKTEYSAIEELKKAAQQKYEEKLKKAQDLYYEKRSRTSNKEKRARYKAQLKEKENDYEDDLDEDLARLRGYQKGLQEAETRLNKNEEITFDAAKSYANDVGASYEDREQARNENRRVKQEQQQKIDNLISGGYQPILVTKFNKDVPENSTLSFYNPQEKKFANVKLNVNTRDVSKLEKSQFKTAKVSQQFTIGGKQFTFNVNAPVFKEQTGKLVTSFGDLGTTEQEALQRQREAERKQEAEFDARASQYLTDVGFRDAVREKPVVDVSFTDRLKALYVASPFGVSVPLPQKYNYLREQRTQDLINNLDITKLNTLTYDQSLEAVQEQKTKEARAEQQIELINKFNEITEQAPEDIQFYVQSQGLAQLGAAGIRSSTKDGQIEFTSFDFEPSKSLNLYQWEQSEGSTVKRAVLGTRIVSTEALKVYGIGKVIGLGVKGVTAVGSKTYTALGGGLKLSDITVRGGSVTATATVQGSSKAGGVAKGIGLATIGLGITGLYGVSKVQQYQYSKEAFGKAGEQVFYLETAGEIAGFTALAGESALRRRANKKLQQQVQQQNYLKEARAEGLKNLKKYGQFSDSARLSYRQVGVGKDVLSKKGIDSLAKEYSKVTGVSQKEAAKVISEKGIYEQVFKVKSNVPSYERALKFMRTGKAPKVKTNYYATGRYGLFQSQTTGKGTSELAFDFKVSGGKPSNLVLKLTQSKGKFAITNVFEKARYSPKDPTKTLRLKEVVVTKASNIQTKNVGNIKATRFDIENRLLSKYPYGKQRLSFGEATDIGKVKLAESELKKIFNKAGSLSKSSSFQNVRVEVPLYDRLGNLKVARKGEYGFIQGGSGKPSLAQKTPRFDLIDDFLERLAKQEAKRSRGKTLAFADVVDDALKQKGATKSSSISSNIGKAVQGKLETQTSLQNIAVSPTVQTAPNVRAAVRFDTAPAIKDALALEILSGQVASIKSKQDLKTALKLKQKQQQDLSLRQETTPDLALRQTTQQRQATQQTTATQTIVQVVENIIKTPVTQTPIRTPTGSGGGFPAINLPDVEKIAKIIKLKKAKSRKVDDLYYLPDFTSRAIGLQPIKVTSLDQANKLLKRVNTGFEVRPSVRVQIPN